MSAPVSDPIASGAPERRTEPSAKELLFAALKPLASLRLTVVLFSLSMVLVFFGTVAMMAQGLWTVVDDYFRSFVVWIPVDLVRRFGTVFFNDVASFPKDGSRWPGSFPFPAGWTLGFALLFNLLAAHLVRFKLSWKRSGIIVLHLGVILLMVGELVTGLFAVESTMTLKIGESSNFVDVTREMEIAVTDARDPKVDKVTVVPQHYFDGTGRVAHPELPFDLDVQEYWENTSMDLVDAPGGEDVFAVAPGVWARLQKRSEGAGVDADARSDVPSARVRVLKKGTDEELGQFLLTLWAYQNFEQNRRRLTFPETAVTVDGVKYTLMLRNKRIYKPYEISLLKFEHGKYPGTEIPKDFASTVNARSEEFGNEDDVRIWMNNPLRYAGDSFYQHAVVGQDSGTILQVVRNPGRVLPYVSCTMITLGMLIHFLMRLWTSLNQGKVGVIPGTKPGTKVQPADQVQVYSEPPGLLPKLLPWLVFLVLAGWVGSKAMPPKPDTNGVDYAKLGQIPIREGGRIMPLETLARTSLQSISNLSEVKNEKGDVTATAMQWLVDVLDSPDWADGPGAKHKVFRIEHDQLLGKLELPRRPGFFRYSLAEIKPKFSALESAFANVEQKRKDGKALDVYDAKVEELGRKLTQYQKLARARDLDVLPPQAEGGDWQSLRTAERLVMTRLTDEEMEDLRDKAIKRFSDDLEREFGSPDKIPAGLREQLMTRARAYIEEDLGKVARARRGEASPVAGAFTTLIQTARDGKGEEFTKAIDEYQEKYLAHVPEGDQRYSRVEARFLGQMDPFYYAAFLYLFVIVLGLASWLVWHGPLSRAAMLVAVFTLVLHSAALITRMVVMGRPPVTNLYSSAVFIGWGAVGLCLVLEWVYKNGVGAVIAGAVGAATLYLARFLGGSGDTMAMLQAVLDTNFWLATHVTTVTLGYTATLVAGAIAVLYLVRGVATPSLTAESQKTLGQMIYGVLCFATLLSFVGTVLGGIWADESWGRFWGWDPKENGAVLIVIWNALILHARWAGLVKVRGMAVLAVFGNVVTAWSWFGTNQLQIGLHSYGFDDRLASGCFWFWVSQFAVMGFGLIPQRLWLSAAALNLGGLAPVAGRVEGAKKK